MSCLSGFCASIVSLASLGMLVLHLTRSIKCGFAFIGLCLRKWKAAANLLSWNKHNKSKCFPSFQWTACSTWQHKLHSIAWLLASSFPQSPTPSECVSSIWKIYEYSHYCFFLCVKLYYLVLVYPTKRLNIECKTTYLELRMRSCSLLTRSPSAQIRVALIILIKTFVFSAMH